MSHEKKDFRTRSVNKANTIAPDTVSEKKDQGQFYAPGLFEADVYTILLLFFSLPPHELFPWVRKIISFFFLIEKIIFRIL